MRKLIVSMMVSADGYAEGPGNNLDWHVWDDEMETYMTAFLEGIDLLIYGRVSYELMIQYWPNAEGHFAGMMNNKEKLVFSSTLSKVEWNSRLVKTGIPEEINRLKAQPGKDMVLFAGPTLLAEMIKHQLVDEYRLIIVPVVLGAGTPVFKNVTHLLNLTHAATRSFKCGNVLLTYQPRNEKQQLLADLENAGKDLLQTLAGFTHGQANITPFEGSWTAAQVAEHVLKSLSGVPQVLTEGIVPTSRPANEKVPVIKSIFLDYYTKMQSPDFIWPSAGPLDKEALANQLQQAIREIQAIAETADLSETCTSFPFPQLGELTRQEWICFVTCHTMRHTRQLKNIYEKIAAA
ncbi:dihydrofolate reductase family protein [Foetidibacter luteolus]|uniref:dihydrofolate reductase family protein n=1 Tax=Foetidibacter luteolus TaxID=2608880 RepID=UPI00129B59D5|nr:dihydrofolate reductase family protein [Foetidibacter luteolus]